MDHKKKLDKEEAELLLNSNPDAAAFWLASGEDLEYRLPDPLYSISRTWEKYEAEVQPESIQHNHELPTSKPEPETTVQNTEEKQAVTQTETISLLKPAVAEEPVSKSESTDIEQEQVMKPATKKVTKKPRSKDLNEISGETKEVKKRKKTKKSVENPLDFYSWLSSMNPEDHEIPIQKPLRKAIEGKTERKKASKSSKSKAGKASGSEEAVSETLAKLLARQGHRTQAISMYKKLMKKFPQKELTFAAAIKKLKS